ncbi:MAG: FkbM family methyltransferase [Pseudomonadota bacterium]
MKILKSLSKRLDLKLTSKSKYKKLLLDSRSAQDFSFVKAIDPQHRSQCIDNLEHSSSQFRQDLFVLSQLGFKNNGYFVEFGATDGICISNTYLLEKRFGWNGILAEPAAVWHDALAKNRKSHIETKCVWSESGAKLRFNETELSELSTLDDFSGDDSNKSRRQMGRRYDVETISLVDLLDKYNAPTLIDYLSVDTEGSEFDILKAFDFDKYRFGVITCEHNYTNRRKKVFDLLIANGYERKFEEFSNVDDWYVYRG